MAFFVLTCVGDGLQIRKLTEEELYEHLRDPEDDMWSAPFIRDFVSLDRFDESLDEKGATLLIQGEIVVPEVEADEGGSSEEEPQTPVGEAGQQQSPPAPAVTDPSSQEVMYGISPGDNDSEGYRHGPFPSLEEALSHTGEEGEHIMRIDNGKGTPAFRWSGDTWVAV